LVSLISNNPVFYITPDPLRAVGLENLFKEFYVVCYDDKPLVDLLKGKGIQVLSLERIIGKPDTFLRNSGKMLENKLVQDFIAEKSSKKTPAILFFKPSFKLDIICDKKGYIKLGNSADLNRKFEDKIEFFKICKQNNWPVPNGTIMKLGQTGFNTLKSNFGLPFVVQFGRGWAGSTTFFIEDKNSWENIVEKYPQRTVKIAEMIEGPTYLNNACVHGDNVFVTPPAVQLGPVRKMQGDSTSTFGRQWPSGLSQKYEQTILNVTKKIGEYMKKQGYRGWFGMDFLFDKKRKKMLISENNARLTASATFYTQVELKLKQKNPLLYCHVAEFMEKKRKFEWSPLDMNASQFVYRNFSEKNKLVRKSMPSGIYSLDLEFLRNGSGFEDIENKNEIFISFPAEGESISQDVEMFTIEAEINILKTARSYKDWFSDLAKKVETQIEFK